VHAFSEFLGGVLYIVHTVPEITSDARSDADLTRCLVRFLQMEIGVSRCWTLAGGVNRDAVTKARHRSNGSKSGTVL
jgi:hypothetical protein